MSPRSGPHAKFESIPLTFLLRDILKLVETADEARKVVNRGEVLVDGRPRKDFAYPVGLFDVVKIPKAGKFYRIVPGKKGLGPIEISEKEANSKIVVIKNKTVLRKGKVQLNLNDGKNILVDKSDYKVGDSLLIEVPSLKIVEHLPLDKKVLGIVSKGENIGKVGKVKEIVSGSMRGKFRLVCEIDGGEKEVLKDYFVVVGKDKPVITIGE